MGKILTALAINLLAGVFVAFLVYFYESKVTSLKEDLSALTQNQKSLQESLEQKNIRDSEQTRDISTIRDGYLQSKELLSEEKKRITINLLKEYQDLLLKLPAVKSYIKATGNEKLVISTDEKPHEKVDSSMILHDIRESCTILDFLGIFEKRNTYNLPIDISLLFAKLFSEVSYGCTNVLAGIDVIENDSFFVQFGYSLTGVIPWSYPVISERYNNIVRDASEVNKAIRVELQKLTEQ